MEQVLAKRHTLWHERLQASWFSRFVVGLVLVVLLPGLMMWGLAGFYAPDLSKINSLLGVAITYMGVFFTLRRLMSYPGCQSANYILPTVLVWYGLLVGVLFVFRLDYSVYYIFYTAVANVLFCFSSYFFIVRHIRKKVAFLPLGKANGMNEVEGVEWFRLSSPSLNGERVDAIAADLHAEIPDEWQRFLARCTLAGVPVYHYKQLMESLTGRVKINHLAENEFGSLQPQVLYTSFKRLVDLTISLLMLPLLLPVLFIVAAWIKKDSQGPALFVQERMGYRGQLFKVYKFRSMYIDQEGRGFTEGEDDPRITPVGKIIRKYRIDELPQLFNVIKGDMSFIGPRPESKNLSEWYEQDVPFFSYRHIVRPGISGWAQVEQGYAAEIDGMKEKLEYDFYYIKHFSLWLDVLIVFKTIRTVLTGDGAR
ncbi:exopolysaccharide biosynthesis polyprenyl glycosylphosphotransferase [Zobellella aerophila]|uniref:Sugar transferase n=1 Tax=Zobellella aerophila TaxID=870480 RepID=A0ABP6VIQ7_9GAMM